MDYNALIADLLALNPDDVQGMQRLTQLLSDLSAPITRQLLNNVQDLEKLIANINSLDNINVVNSLTPRARFLDRMERLSACESISIPTQGSSTPEPYFQKFDIILCHFGGVGWEYDGPHYALVWEDDHSDSEITIIPTTSQYTKEFADEFSLGSISGLPPRQSILTVKKIMRISRKRVIAHRRTGHYAHGQVHPLNQAFVKERIENALAIVIYGEVPLDHYVRNEIGVALPVDFLTHYPSMRFMPVREVVWERTVLQLNFRKWNEARAITLQMKNPTAVYRVNYKKYNIYDPLFSNNSRRMSAAAEEFNRVY